MMRLDLKCALLAPLVFCLFSVGGTYALDSPSGNSTQQSGRSPASPSTPALRVPETVFDFGLAMEEDEVVHDFMVINAGMGPLEIQQVIAG